MNQQTKSVLLRTLSLIEDYQNSKTGLSQLVGALEGSLNALEEQLPEAFYKEWYDHWGNLDVAVALGVEAKNQEEILEEIRLLEEIIKGQLQTE